MAKQGRATRQSVLHGVEESPQWLLDKQHNHSSSKELTWVPVKNSDAGIFKSDIAALRDSSKRGAESNWGYQVSDDIYGHLKSVYGGRFSDRLNQHRKLLATHYDLSNRKNPSDGKTYFQAQKRKEPKGESFLERITIDASPEISRAFQISIEKIAQLPKEEGDVKLFEIRLNLEYDLTHIVKEFKKIYSQAKVVGAAWHVSSGQLHCDLWAHGCYDKSVIVGKKAKEKTLRFRDPSALCHYGPGSGVVAWDRHIRVLKDEADQVASAIVQEVASACNRAEERAKLYNRIGTENRDIRIHRAIDSRLSQSVDKESLEKATAQYKDHLKEFYSNADSLKNIDEEWHKELEAEKQRLEFEQIRIDLHEENVQQFQENVGTHSNQLAVKELLIEEELQHKEKQLDKREFNLEFQEAQLQIDREEIMNQQAQNNVASVNLAIELNETRLLATGIKQQLQKVKAFNLISPLLNKLLPALRSVEKKLKPVLQRFKLPADTVNKLEQAMQLSSKSTNINHSTSKNPPQKKQSYDL